MIKRIAKAAAVVILALVGLAGVLYGVGFRIQMDGGGTPRLRLVASANRQAEEIARHREAQRAQAPPVRAEPVEPPPLSSPSSVPAGSIRTSVVPDVTAASRYWTDFRGPNRDGHYRHQRILTNWPQDGPKRIWKQPVGGGHASFVIANGRAFTIEQRGEEEVVAAYGVTTGRELWKDSWTATFSESMGGDGPRATPTWASGRVYALGGTGELRALDDATGRVIWRTNILADAGRGQSPMGHGGFTSCRRW